MFQISKPSSYSPTQGQVTWTPQPDRPMAATSSLNAHSLTSGQRISLVNTSMDAGGNITTADIVEIVRSARRESGMIIVTMFSGRTWSFKTNQRVTVIL